MEDKFKLYWDKHIKIPIQVQYLFHPERKFRFDFAFPDVKLALEMQGYGPGHASFKEMYSDYCRHNEAVKLGWKILYFMQPHIHDDRLVETAEFVKEIYCQLAGKPFIPPPKKKPLGFMDILKDAEHRAKT